MQLVDTHCHLDMLDLTVDQGDVNNVIKRAQKNNVNYFLNVCVSIAEFETVLNTAVKSQFVAASVGLHPNYQDEEVDAETLIKLGKHDKVIAIGETGLDYYRSEGDVEWQRTRFRAHIEAAKILKKPLIIHTRDAKEDTIRLMREENAAEIGGIMHCFTEDWETAKQALDMNFYISFSGIVTFKNAEAVQLVAKQVPLDRMLLETDAPYLAPIPFRGKPNEPAYMRYTAEYLAALRGIELEKLADQTTANFFKLCEGAAKAYV